MALILEDGSLVVDANSFVSVAEVRAFADARASIIPADDADGNAAIEAACIVATDYLESLRGEYQGYKVAASTQSLQWPRIGVLIDGAELPETEIPKILKSAQCQLAIEISNGLDITPTTDGREVLRKKVDVLETEWAKGSGGSPQPVLEKVNRYLAPLLKSGNGRIAVIRA